MGTPVDDRLRSSSAKQTETFRKGAALLELPPDIVDIPYEATTLPGYFFRTAIDDGGPLGDPPDAEDGRLGRVHDRGERLDAVAAEIGDRERAA